MNTLVAMVAALSALSPLAGAEEVESESSSEPRMREVSVTATRTERAVDDVPATVTAIDSRQMERDITAEASRVETLLAALLYLMTAYQRTGCRRIAACVAAHLDCVAGHPAADATIREVCAGMRSQWWSTAHAPAQAPARGPLH